MMNFSRLVLMFAVFVALGGPVCSYAGENPVVAIRGTWNSEGGSLTFTNGGTVNYKGKNYFYAVTSGGTIQLQSRHGSKTLSFQLAGDKLTLTADGKTTVYMRKR